MNTGLLRVTTPMLHLPYSGTAPTDRPIIWKTPFVQDSARLAAGAGVERMGTRTLRSDVPLPDPPPERLASSGVAKRTSGVITPEVRRFGISNPTPWSQRRWQRDGASLRVCGKAAGRLKGGDP
jgi:hypothetical protein